MSNLNKALQQVYKQEEPTHYNSLTKEDLDDIIYSLTAGQVNWITADNDIDKKCRREFEKGDLVQLKDDDSGFGTDGCFYWGEQYDVLSVDYTDNTILLSDEDGDLCWEEMDYFEVL